MKKSIKKIFQAILVVVLGVVVLTPIQSCGNEESVNRTSSNIANDQFAKDLKDLSSSLEKVCIINKESHVTRSSANDSLVLASIIAELEMKWENFFSKYDLFSDLTAKEKGSLKINPNEIEIMKLDRDAIERYMLEHKTPEFNVICNNLITNTNYNLSNDDIVSNEKLKLNEKLSLMVVSTVKKLDDLTPMELEEYEKTVEEKIKICNDRYDVAIERCKRNLLLMSVLAVAVCIMETPAGGGVIAVTAAFDYDDCKDEAHTNYKYCVEDATAGH